MTHVTNVPLSLNNRVAAEAYEAGILYRATPKIPVSNFESTICIHGVYRGFHCGAEVIHRGDGTYNCPICGRIYLSLTVERYDYSANFVNSYNGNEWTEFFPSIELAEYRISQTYNHPWIYWTECNYARPIPVEESE